MMYKTIKVTEYLNAISYAGIENIRIQIAYPKDDIDRMHEAISQFWKEYERESINLTIVNGKKK